MSLGPPPEIGNFLGPRWSVLLLQLEAAAAATAASVKPSMKIEPLLHGVRGPDRAMLSQLWQHFGSRPPPWPNNPVRRGLPSWSTCTKAKALSGHNKIRQVRLLVNGQHGAGVVQRLPTQLEVCIPHGGKQA